MDQTFQYDIFLSFSGEDQESARNIFTQLASYGVRVFFSDETLKSDAGSAFYFRIETGLEHSQHFLLAATHNSMRSHWVRVEYSTFYTAFHVHDGERRRFFIVLPDKDFDRRELPLLLRSLQIPESVEAIARIVQASLSQPPVPASKPRASESKSQAPFTGNIGRFEENVLSLFGSHRVESVDGSLLRRFLGHDADVMLLDTRLLRTVDTVRSLKQALQALDHPDPKVLMGTLARLLNKTQRSEPLQGRFLYELIRRTYYPTWSQSQIDGSDKAAKALLTWRDVYVSYTDRDGIVKLRRSAQTGVYENRRAQLSWIPISA
jgi:hypothetical protein